MWQSCNTVKSHLSEQMDAWLCQTGHLFQRLQQVYPALVLQQDGPIDATEYWPDEIELLPSNEIGLIRQVRMQCLDTQQTIIQARTFVPKTTYQVHQEAFDQLGNRPIGRTLLYNNAAVQRSGFYVATYSPKHIWQRFRIQRQYPCWARASLFYWKGVEPLLIIEYFITHPPLPRQDKE